MFLTPYNLAYTSRFCLTVSFLGNSIYGEAKFIKLNNSILLFEFKLIPLIRTSPLVGVINPSIIPMEVVFPQPLGPSNPNVLFFSISKLMLFTAIVELNFLIRFFTSSFIKFLMLVLFYH